MDQIRRRGLYFLDSRTTAASVAEATARDWAVPTIHRDVFLDHDGNFRIERIVASSLFIGDHTFIQCRYKTGPNCPFQGTVGHS
ncbi:MAG: divergent polysaccharide deacetylase family protein [Candidatus Hodarchaeota archaeon]